MNIEKELKMGGESEGKAKETVGERTV